MEIKTAQFKNRLSHYLRQVKERGETIVVLDRDEPVAMLCPLDVRSASPAPSDWTRKRAVETAAMKKAGLTLVMPSRPAKAIHAKPTPAPDGKTSLHTVDLVRKGRDY